MMDIVELACKDAEAFVRYDGREITLTESDGTEHTVYARVNRVDHITDPDTGAEMMEPGIGIQISTRALGQIPDETWAATVEDGTGIETTGQLMSVRVDRARCVVDCVIEVYE